MTTSEPHPSVPPPSRRFQFSLRTLLLLLVVLGSSPAVFGAGDFRAVLRGTGHKIQRLSLARIYGKVAKDGDSPDVTADYVSNLTWRTSHDYMQILGGRGARRHVASECRGKSEFQRGQQGTLAAPLRGRCASGTPPVGLNSASREAT